MPEFNEEISKLEIKLNIDNKQYSFKIRRGDTERESLLRKSAEVVNNCISKFREKYGNAAGFGEKDIIALAMFDYVSKALKEEQDVLQSKKNLEDITLKLKGLNRELGDIITEFENNIEE